MTTPHNRREFLEQMGLTSGVVLAGYTATARGYAASETLNIGCIGTGGRCQQLMRALKEVPGARITAVCDIWDVHLEAGKRLAEPGAFATKNHHDLLDRKDVDAVIIGTPDHWHVPITVDACAAGKDVYVEKPLTHDLSEGAAVDRRAESLPAHRAGRHAAAQHAALSKGLRNRQVGPVGRHPQGASHLEPQHPPLGPRQVQCRSGDGRLEAIPGHGPRAAVRRVSLSQLALVLGFRRRHLHRPDGALRRRRTLVPRRSIIRHVATTIGDTFKAKGLWETPDTVQTLLQYPDRQVQVYFEGTFVNARNGAMLEFMGSEATLYLDRGRYEIHPERNKKVAASELVLGSGPRGADFYDQPKGEVLHLANWIECIRSRKKPNCPAEAGVSAAAAAHLANRALRGNQVATWGE